jgi:hypothetical protein
MSTESSYTRISFTMSMEWTQKRQTADFLLPTGRGGGDSRKARVTRGFSLQQNDRHYRVKSFGIKHIFTDLHLFRCPLWIWHFIARARCLEIHSIYIASEVEAARGIVDFRLCGMSSPLTGCIQRGAFLDTHTLCHKPEIQPLLHSCCSAEVKTR